MTGAVLKLSYNNVGDSSLEGGICGSFFFANENLAITAHHILSKDKFIPNSGFTKCQFWLLMSSNLIIEINEDDLIGHPEIDLTVVKLFKKYNSSGCNFSKNEPRIDACCHNIGFVGGEMPEISIRWENGKLVINGFSLDRVSVIGKGMIKDLKIVDVKSADVNIKNIKCIEVSYGGVVGMSGAPLLDSNGNVIGMMSIGLPINVPKKETLLAIHAQEIMAIVNMYKQ